MEETGKPTLWERLGNALSADDIFHETEVQANYLGSRILVSSGVILIVILVLTMLGVFPLALETITRPVIPGIACVLVLYMACRSVDNDAWWLKYLLMAGLVLLYALFDCMLTHKVAILMVLPVVFSSRYFSQNLTIATAILTAVAFCISATLGATYGLINLNIVTMPLGTQIVATGGFLGEAVLNAGVSAQMLVHNTLLYDYLPRWMMFVVAAFISRNIAVSGRNLVITQHEKDVSAARIESELNLASRLQADMLPNMFPAFPEREEIDIYAVMDPAKEVGGDFYDFFFIDQNRLCLVIADVSDKGVPAALFMMSSKILLAYNAKSGKSPAQILEDTNNAICSNNHEDMFVSVWLGILDLTTGILTAANAGHEYPAFRQRHEAYQIVNDTHGLVLGAMEGIPYREYTMSLEPGSRLFVYTDGVPEATDAQNAMFGMDRMLAVLNEQPEADPRQTLLHMRHAVDEFVNDAEQFDDLTMLCIEYRGVV